MVNVKKRIEELEQLIDQGYGLSRKQRKECQKEIDDLKTVMEWIMYQSAHLSEGTYDNETRETAFKMKNTTRLHFKTFSFPLITDDDAQIPITVSDWKPREVKTISFFHDFNNDWSYKTNNVLHLKSDAFQIEYELFDRKGDWNTGLSRSEFRKTADNNSRIRGQLVVLKAFRDAVLDPNMRAKAKKIEELAIQINDRVRENPELESQAERFFETYLPTVCRTLDKYAKAKANGLEGNNANEMRKNAEETLNLSVTAFTNLRDKLYDSAVQDGTVDVSVMKTLMQKDGLL